MGRRDGAEVADGGEVGPLGVVDAVDDLRHQEREVGVALPVGVGRTIDRHVVDEVGEIGSVVEVEAADQVLIGFAFAGMDRDDEAGDAFEQLARPHYRPQRDFLFRDVALASGGSGAEQVCARGSDNNLFGVLRAL